jgi:hypothetical protein
MYPERFTGAGVSHRCPVARSDPAKTPVPNTGSGARELFTQAVGTCRCGRESSGHCLIEPEIAFAHGAVQCLEALL